MAKIGKREGKRKVSWYCDWFEDGKRKRKFFDNKVDAESYYDAFIRKGRKIFELTHVPKLNIVTNVAINYALNGIKQIINYEGAMGVGIYFLCNGGKVVYIGQSVCMMGRIAIHYKNDAIEFDSICILEVDEALLSEKEKELIEYFKPKYNIQYNTQSEDK